MNKNRIIKIPEAIQSQRKTIQKIIVVRQSKIVTATTLVMTVIGNAKMSVTGLASETTINVETKSQSAVSAIITNGGRLSGQIGTVKVRMNGSSASGMSEKGSSAKIAV